MGDEDLLKKEKNVWDELNMEEILSTTFENEKRKVENENEMDIFELA